MLRSNSKEALKSLGDYLLKTETGLDRDPTTAEEAAAIIAGFFNDYLGNGKFRENELRRCGSYQEAFIDWMQGLACNVAEDIYCYSSARVILGDILKETESERNRYSEQEAEYKLSAMIWIHYVSKEYYKIAGGF